MKTMMMKNQKWSDQRFVWTIHPEDEGGTIMIDVARDRNGDVEIKLHVFNDYEHGDDKIVYRLTETQLTDLCDDAWEARTAANKLKAGYDGDSK